MDFRVAFSFLLTHLLAACIVVVLLNSGCEEPVNPRSPHSQFILAADSVTFTHYRVATDASVDTQGVWITVDLFRNTHLNRLRIPGHYDGDSIQVKFPVPPGVLGVTTTIAPVGVQIPVDAFTSRILIDELRDSGCDSRGWGILRRNDQYSSSVGSSNCTPAARADNVIAGLMSMRTGMSLFDLQKLAVDVFRLRADFPTHFRRAAIVISLHGVQATEYAEEVSSIQDLLDWVRAARPLSFVEQQALAPCIGRQMARLSGHDFDGQFRGDEGVLLLFALATDVRHVYLASGLLQHAPGLVDALGDRGLAQKPYVEFCRFWLGKFLSDREIYHAFSSGALNLIAMLALGSEEIDLVDDIDAIRLKYLESSRRVVSRHPGDVVPFYVIDDLRVDLAALMAKLYDKRGDTESSIRFLEESLAESTGSSLMMRASAHLNLVDRYMEIGKKRDATRHFSLAVDMIESNPTLQSLVDSIGQRWGLRVDSSYTTRSSVARVFSPFVVRSRTGASVRFPNRTDQATLLLFTSSGCAPCVRDFPDLWHYLEQAGLSSSTYLIVRRDDRYSPEQVPADQILDFSNDFYSIGLFDALPEVFVLHGDTTVANANTFKVEEVKAVLNSVGGS